ncbi:MAG: oxidoreductase [Bacteroidetes bacterium]|nr:MAG: oxidoreductase [Bacteroidota bacterium]
MQLSFWEKDRFFTGIDVLVVGSGIVGLNAALGLKKKAPSLHVAVIERGILPSGASTRNAGFACFGSCTELIDDLKTNSENDVFALVERRYRGLKRLRENLGDEAIRFEGNGGYEVFDEEPAYAECLDHIADFNRHMKAITGAGETYRRADEDISRFGFSGVNHLILNTAEGQIDTGRMMDALIEKVSRSGVKIINGLGINSFSQESGKVVVHTDQDFSISCRRLLICTNGFARQLLPDYDVEPARAQVLITKPIPGLRVQGTFHYQKGYYYFRNVGERLLFGGGRNMDFANEKTTDMSLNPLIQDRLEHLLSGMILPGVNYEIEQRWSGIMGVGSRKSSIVQPVQENVFCAVRMGGMGVAIGSLVGEDAAEMVIKSV